MAQRGREGRATDPPDENSAEAAGLHGSRHAAPATRPTGDVGATDEWTRTFEPWKEKIADLMPQKEHKALTQLWAAMLREAADALQGGSQADDASVKQQLKELAVTVKDIQTTLRHSPTNGLTYARVAATATSPSGESAAWAA
jgi:hypothetical protein